MEHSCTDRRSKLAKSDFVYRSSHAKLTEYQRLEHWKKTPYQPVHFKDAFANLFSYDS
jgi:hypothetical protein